jgi:hypothetical protein
MLARMGKHACGHVNARVGGYRLNGALYFVEMDADGGMSKYPDNAAGSSPFRSEFLHLASRFHLAFAYLF